MPRHGIWTEEEALSAFLAGGTFKALCKRLGGSPNTIRRVLKDRLGEKEFELIRDRNDPKRSAASEAEILASFHTDASFKTIAAQLKISPNTLRDRWVLAFGKEAFDTRSKRSHSVAGAKAGLSWKGKKRVSAETLQARDIARKVDRRCSVCNIGCVGYQALINHMSRRGDDAHMLALRALRERELEERLEKRWVGLEEGKDYVVCAICGIKGAFLNNHIKTHNLTCYEYRVKYPKAPLIAQCSEVKRKETLTPYFEAASFNWTREDLQPYADEKGAIIVAEAVQALKASPWAVLKYCRLLGLPTRNKLAWQRYVLDQASLVYGPYEWEWSDPRIVNPETGWKFCFDGFFSKYNVIVEAHGDQHYRYSESWHGSLANFHLSRDRDTFKKECAEKLGYKYVVVRTSDPMHDLDFWHQQLRADSKSAKTNLDAAINQTLIKLRQEGFPEITVDNIELKKAVTRLQLMTVYVDDQFLIRPYSTVGTVACTSFFPQRYHARHLGAKSVWEAWHIDEDLKKAIKLQIESGHPTSAFRVLRALVFFHRTPSVFRPAVAKYIYQRYSNQGVIWDPCAGYGSRLLAAMVVGAKRYIGNDIEQSTVLGNLTIAKCLDASDRCLIIHKKAEEFDPCEELDLVFTSPPYYNLESYGPSSISEILYRSSKGWVTNFLTPVLMTAYSRLKKGGFLVLNLPSKPVEGLRLDLEAGHIAKMLGFAARECLWLPIRQFKGTLKGEPVLVWQKC